MSDLFTPLREYQPAVNPLDAGEVRRLGERRRRRHVIAGASAAACMVLAAIAVGISGTHLTDSSPPPPAEEPTESPRSAAVIPEDFPLGRGLPVAEQVFDTRGASVPPFTEFVDAICGKDYRQAGEPVDRAAINMTRYVKSGLGIRDLLVYASPADGLAAARSFVRTLEKCPRDRSSGGLTTTTVAPLADLGDHAWTALRLYSYSGDVVAVEHYFIVQRGAAVLVMHEQGSEGPLMAEDTRQAYLEKFRTQTLEPVVAALCAIEGPVC